MADRDMSYALDGAFSTRNQGELIRAQPVPTTQVRTPGLIPMTAADVRAQSIPFAGMELAGDRPRGIFAGLGEMLAGDITLPVIGTVDKKVAVIGGLAATAALYWFVLRKKR